MDQQQFAQEWKPIIDEQQQLNLNVDELLDFMLEKELPPLFKKHFSPTREQINDSWNKIKLRIENE